MNYTSWNHIADVYAKVTQSCPTLCSPLVWPTRLHGILQARKLEWVVMSFSRGSSRPRDGTQASCRLVYHLHHQGGIHIIDVRHFNFYKLSS